MLIFLVLTISIFNLNDLEAKSFKVLHYNVKELSSIKLRRSASQIESLKFILKDLNFDLLSINEIQYDRPNIPDESFKTKAQNMDILKKHLSLNNMFSHMSEANTGLNAKKYMDKYFTDYKDPNSRKYADKINFGIMPGQYSTGLFSKFEILSSRIIKDLKWKKFNPSIELSKFRSIDGNDIPKNIQLFDKSFTDLTLKIDNKIVHVILLHTVPAYDFGNKLSINYIRNADQLRFLEWYLTGETDFKVELSLPRLSKESYFIAMGDFNVSIKSKHAPGAKVLKRLLNKTNPWIDKNKMTFTNEAETFAPKPMRLLLDYIITSKNIKPIKGKILHPDFKSKSIGCFKDLKHKIPTQKDQKVVSYTHKQNKCYSIIYEDYFHFKNASDHYPIYGEFEIK